MPLLPESASPGDVPLAEVFPQDLFLVLSNQDQLARSLFPCFTCGWLQDLQLLGKTGEGWFFPAQDCPSSVTAIPHREAVFCSISEGRSRGCDVFTLASTSHTHGRAFVGLGLPFCYKSDCRLFFQDLQDSFKTPTVSAFQ